jgi:hypothetical protein
MIALYYVTDNDQFECDFVLARTANEARQIFAHTYGEPTAFAAHVERIKLCPGVAEPGWIGPDSEELIALGGVRSESAAGFPLWTFPPSTVAIGCQLPVEQRYPRLKE